MDDVVAALAVEEVAGAVVGVTQRVVRDEGRHRLVVRVGRDVLGVAARVVVEQDDRARDHLQRAAVGVVVEAQELAVTADEAVDDAVVAEDHVGVARVACRRRVARVVNGGAAARAAVDRVGAVGPRRPSRQVERRAAPDQVVLAEVAEDEVAAAAALDIVVAVGRSLGRGAGRQVHRAVALDRVVAHLAEEHVVARAARDDVVAEHRGVGGAVVIQPDQPLGHTGRVEPRGAYVGDDRAANDRVDRRGRQWPDTLAQLVAAEDRRVVAGHDVVAGPGVDAVAGVLPARHVVAADHVVVARAGVDHVGALLPEDDVLSVLAVDGVRAAAVAVLRVDRREDERVDLHRQRQQSRVDAAADDRLELAEVAEDQVVARTRLHGVARRAREDEVVAGAGRDRVGAAEGRVGRLHPVDVARVAVQQRPVDEAVVAEDDAVRVGQQRGLAAIRRDRVAAEPAEDDVAAHAVRHDVGAADERVDRDNEADGPLHAVRLVARPAVTEHRRGERLEQRERGRVRRRWRQGRVEVEDAAAVAEDDVAAGAAVDPVRALAAEDDQRQRRGGRVDRVVVGVGQLRRRERLGQVLRDPDDHEAARGGRDRAAGAVEGAGQAVDEDGDVVAGADRPGEREEPARVDEAGVRRDLVDRHGDRGAPARRERQRDRVQRGVDDVAARVEQDAVDGHAHAVGGDRQVAVADVGGQVHDVVVGALRVEDEEALGRGSQRHRDVVVAEAGVQPGDLAHACALVRAVDADRVGPEAGPDRDAVGEVAGRVGPEGDRAGGEADDEDLALRRDRCVARRRGAVVARDQHASGRPPWRPRR